MKVKGQGGGKFFAQFLTQKRCHVTNLLFTLVEIYGNIRKITHPPLAPYPKNTNSGRASQLTCHKWWLGMGRMWFSWRNWPCFCDFVDSWFFVKQFIYTLLKYCYHYCKPCVLWNKSSKCYYSIKSIDVTREWWNSKFKVRPETKSMTT